MDQFGEPIQLNFRGEEGVFKTFYGGLVSCFGVNLLMLLYVIVIAQKFMKRELDFRMSSIEPYSHEQHGKVYFNESEVFLSMTFV
jgi:hypothetical protein